MRFWSRRDGLAFLLTFLVAFGVYIYSLPDSITMEDAGELAVAADYLGVPHPPGYPIWTFIAWVFQGIFHGVSFRGYPNPAWAISLMSGFFGSLACACTALLTSRFSRQVIQQGISTTPCSLTPLWPARAVGAGAGLLVCLLIQRFPSAGGLILQTTLFLLLLTAVFQFLTPAEKTCSWQQALPSCAQLGAGFYYFLISGVCWLAAWTLAVVPSLSRVLILALAGLLAFTLLTLLLDYVLGIAARRPSLERDFLKTGVDVLTGIGAGLLLAFTPLMWSQSVIVEVYSLNAFFLSILLVLIYEYIQQPGNKVLYLTAFLFGLGLTNHQSLLFIFFFLVAGVAAANKRNLLKDGLFLVGLGALGFLTAKSVQYHNLNDHSATLYFMRRAVLCVLFLLTLTFTGRGLFRTWKQLLILALLGMLGLSFHLYMPLASARNPPMNWGNTKTKAGFIEALTRGQYAKFSVAGNIDTIRESMSTPVDPEWLKPENRDELAEAYAQRTLFIRKLGAYFYNPDWKYSIASQFSWSIPTQNWDPASGEPAPEGMLIPLALLGLLPLFVLSRLQASSRNWISCTLVAMFFLSVAFLVIQWPSLAHNDLWVKRVQYVQSHVVFAFWMGIGGLFTLMIAYALIPWRHLPVTGASALLALFVVFPLHKDHADSQHIASLGTSNLRGYDFGWQYGFHQLKGANGILLDELAHHENPDALWNDWAIQYVRQQGVSEEVLQSISDQAGDTSIPVDQFMEGLDLSNTVRRSVREGATLAAFRALSPEEQQQKLVYLHRPLPDWDYPEEMDREAILFGGTDPGRFVNTYMVYSAHCRPDVRVLTQNALAQPSYLAVMRDLYGQDIYIPDDTDNSTAFGLYANNLRLFDTDAFVRFVSSGSKLSVTGFYEVMKINATLSRLVFEKNQSRHSLYLEESVPIPWMIPYQKPNGLLFKLSDTPSPVTREELEKNREFWEWMEEWLLHTDQRFLYLRELQVQKSYAKLRLAQAQNFRSRGLIREAEAAMHQALRLYPGGTETVQVASLMFMKLGKFEEAALVLARYAQLDPTNPFIPRYTRLLRIYQEKHRERVKLEAELRGPQPGNTALQLVYLYHELDMNPAMEDMADRILAMNTLQPPFYTELARYMRSIENKVYYQKALRRWAEKDPADPRPHVDLAVIALTEGDQATLYSHLLTAIRIDGNDARHHLIRDPRFYDIRDQPRFQNLIAPVSEP